MEKHVRLPGISCNECNGDLVLHARTKRARIDLVMVKCDRCGYGTDLLEEAKDQYSINKENLKNLSKQVAKSLVELRDTLPRTREDLGEAIRNPQHPFTAAVLAGLVLVAMDLSGFGVFMAVTWILGNVILNPFGWALIPVIVAIGFAYRRMFRREHLAELHAKLEALERDHEEGRLTLQEFREARQSLISEYFR